MPLSDDEIRILQEIEKNFYDSDPEFAREVGTAKLTRNAGRNLRWSAAGFVAGLIILILGFTRSVFLGFLGFAVMVAAGFWFYVNAASIGRSSLASVSAPKIGEVLGKPGQRLRDRLRRDDDRA